MTSAEVSPDMRHAHIKVAIEGGQEKKTLAVLDSAKNFLRHELASRLNLHRIPEVHFFVDSHPDADSRIDFLRAHRLTTILGLIGNLKPLDRQTFLLYLEGETAASIAEITGLSAANVATKLHRIRKILIERFNEGTEHDCRSGK